MKTLAPRIAAFALLALACSSPAALADSEGGGGGPTFSWSPSLPYTQDTVTFTSSSASSSQTWSFGPKAAPATATGPTATVRFSKGGAYSVTLQSGGSSLTRTIYVRNRKPVAAFTVSDPQPAQGQVVTFDGRGSTDPDGTIASWEWDWDNDGKYDSTGQTVQHSFTRGWHVVTLRVTDDQGATATTQLTLLADKPPSAAFGFDPPSPVAGQVVRFTSQAASEGGSIAKQEWDLHGDGTFGDGSGAAATAAYPAGSYTAALRVVDDLGVTSTSFQTFTVAPPASPGGAPAGAGAPGGDSAPGGGGGRGERARGGFAMLDPRPFVRIRGRTTGRGALIDLFTVRAQSGATVRIVCMGNGCPLRARSAVVPGRGAGIVRFKAVEKLLRAGIVLEVHVTKQGYVGRFTRFRIGRLKAPVRWDGCLMPGHSVATDCGGGIK